MTAGRAGAAPYADIPAKVVDGLLESRRGIITAGAFGKSGLVSTNVVNRPMVPFATGSIGVIAEQDETACHCLAPLPSQGVGKHPLRRR